MPKNYGTKKQLRKELFQRITPAHLFNNTSVFSTLDAATKELVRQRYTLFYETWLEPPAREFILNEKGAKE